MKKAINAEGVEVQVSNETTVKTIDGIHYLLTAEDQVVIQAEEYFWQEEAIQRLNEISISNRKSAYVEESDPVFFKYQRGESTRQEWLDKIIEIKTRYPKS